MENEKIFERVAGNLGTKAIATAIAAVGQGHGVDVAAFLPILVDFIPSARHKDRVEAAIQSLRDDVNRLDIKFSDLSDQQYKVALDTLETIQKTIDQDKIDFLKNIFLGATQTRNLDNNIAYKISRAVRDISTLEFRFITENFGGEFIFFSDSFFGNYNPDGSIDHRYRIIERNSLNEELLAGLQTLGLVVQSQREIPSFEFTQLAAKILALFNNGNYKSLG